MNKEFETWWNINKFRLMEDDEVGLREIALAAYLAGNEAAEQSVQRTVDQPCAKHNMEFCSECYPAVVVDFNRG